MWELDYKEIWVLKNWCFWTVVLEKTLESPLDSMEIKPAHPKGNQSWIFIGRTDAEVETPILWLPDEKNWHIGKDTDAEKDWRWEEKGTTEDEMVRWHHHLNGHEFEQALGAGDGQGGQACCSPWGYKESDTTEQVNWTEPFDIEIALLQVLLSWIFSIRFSGSIVHPSFLHHRLPSILTSIWIWPLESFSMWSENWRREKWEHIVPWQGHMLGVAEFL